MVEENAAKVNLPPKFLSKEKRNVPKKYYIKKNSIDLSNKNFNYGFRLLVPDQINLAKQDKIKNYFDIHGPTLVDMMGLRPGRPQALRDYS